MANGIELATAYVSLAVDGSKVDAGVRKSLSGVDAQADAVGRSSGKKMGAGISGGILGAVGKLAGPIAAVFAGIHEAAPAVRFGLARALWQADRDRARVLVDLSRAELAKLPHRAAELAAVDRWLASN